jgi:hypothetical protein
MTKGKIGFYDGNVAVQRPRVRMRQTRMRAVRRETQSGLFCQAETTSSPGQRRNFPPLALLIIIPVRPKAMEVKKTTINSVVHMA